MFRSFRLTLAVVIISAGLVTIGLRSAMQTPPPRPQPVQHVTRGPKDPEAAKRAAWLRSIQTKDALEANAAMIVLDNDMIAGFVGILTALTLLFALLSKYIVAPMIDSKLSAFGKMFIDKDMLTAHAALDEERHEHILRELDSIRKAVE